MCCMWRFGVSLSRQISLWAIFYRSDKEASINLIPLFSLWSCPMPAQISLMRLPVMDQ